MKVRRYEWPVLVGGDVCVFFIALYVTLFVRYADPPSVDFFVAHFIPFSILACVWILVFVISGLYEKHTTLLRGEIPTLLIRAQITNVIIAAAFFFLIPLFGVSPKTNLFIFLVISSALLILWRLFLFPLLGFKKHQKAVLIGAKKEMRELYEEVNQNPRYDIQFVDFIDTGSRNPNEVQQQALKRVMVDGVGVVVTDLGDKNLDALGPLLYNLSLTQSRVHLVDFGNFYTDVFGRIPVGVVSPEWLIKHLHSERHIAYMVGKRIIDVGGAVVLGIFSLILFPFIAIAIKMDDGGPLFIAQERVGYGGSRIRIYKFRTMTGTTSDEGTEVLKSEKKITRVGAFLRKTRLDELPQLYSVLVGDQSLVGPRPELPALVEVYAQKVPHYSARHMVPPGLSGWAQIHHQAHPHHGTDVYETMQKISYDLYYVKNRSLFLDFFIALRTVYILLSRVGK